MVFSVHFHCIFIKIIYIPTALYVLFVVSVTIIYSLGHSYLFSCLHIETWSKRQIFYRRRLQMHFNKEIGIVDILFQTNMSREILSYIFEGEGEKDSWLRILGSLKRDFFSVIFGEFIPFLVEFINLKIENRLVDPCGCHSCPIICCLYQHLWVTLKTFINPQLHLKSPASRLFAQPYAQAQIKESTKAPRHWPLWGESTSDRRIPLTKD